MNTENKNQFLRAKAVSLLKERLLEISPKEVGVSISSQMHELEVHQIELELQNDELRNTQVELEQAIARYSEFYELAPVGYISLIETGQISAINLTGAQLIGVERSKILRKHFSSYISPEDRNSWRRFFSEVQNTNSKNFCELTIIKENGSSFYANLEYFPQLNVPGTTEYRVVLSDISKRKYYEDALRDQQVFFSMITENSDEFIAVLDLKGRRLYNSQSYSKLFGSVDKLVGTDSFAEIHPDDRKYLRQVFNETVQTGTGMQAEFRFVLPDGSIRYMESRGTLVRNSKGIALRVVVVSRDVTDRKHAAETISSLALHDPLTGKSNLRLLQDRLDRVITANKRKNYFGALLFITLDKFTFVNEIHGQETCDLMIIEASSRITKCVRELDTVSRVSGDEFVVLLSELSAEKAVSTTEAGTVAEKIQKSLSKPYILSVPNENFSNRTAEITCNASIGVLLFDHANKAADEIINRGQSAMHRIKNPVKNQFFFIDPIIL